MLEANNNKTLIRILKYLIVIRTDSISRNSENVVHFNLHIEIQG